MSRVITLPPDESPASDGARVGGWWQESDDGRRIRCGLCPRGCSLGPGDHGFCSVRENRDGQMYSTTYGRSTGFCIDPIEKKPLNHFFPGTAVLSFGTAGCNLGCVYCQNWTSTKSRDVRAASELARPEIIAEAARDLGCRSVAFTYNDPIVWAEYAMDTARACHRRGIKTVAVTSGYMNPAARAAFYEHIDAANVDLKGFSDEFYREMTGGHLEPVLDTLRWIARQSETWLEITNLIIPRANDAPEQIQRMCRWIVEELGPEVPLHFSAFHPDFKLLDRGTTPLETLVMAHDVARQAGLHYVYTGNVADRRRQATYCPECGQAVIERDGYAISGYRIREGCCTDCGRAIAGCFDDRPGDWGGRRLPVGMARYERVGEPSAAVSPILPPTPGRPALSIEHEQRVLQAAGQRVAATVRGEMPPRVESILGDAAEIPVYGAFVTLRRAGQLRSCCGFLGKTAPLWEALDHAAMRAAKDDPRFPPILPDELQHLDMDVWLLWGLQPVHARGRDRIGAITIGRHGVQVSRGGARGLLLPGVAVDHHLDAKAFLEQVCLKAGLPTDAWRDDSTTVATFEGLAIHGRLKDGLPAEETAAEPDVRPAVVAGAFYPGTPHEIQRMLEMLFAEVPALEPEPWAAALVPHAGWVYSGRVAAATLARVRIPSRVIILSPRHRRGGSEWAVAPHARWTWPGGQLESDLELARRLAGAVAGLQLDAEAHRQEHAIEVQLPILARLAPQTRVVGIAVSGGGLPRLRQFAQQMAGVLRDLRERPLLVISSDLNHYADDTRTRQLDRLALDAIESLDPAALYEVVRREQISMCGLAPAVIAMETLRQLDSLGCFQLVSHITSAETSGDTERVVGYAGVLLK